MLVLCGVAAFALFFLFDEAKRRKWCHGWNLCFAAGICLLAGATAGLLFASPSWRPGWTGILCLACMAVCFLLLLYALFFALPFRKTYVTGENSAQVVDTGMYALCRHPGVIWFCLAYLFLYLARGTGEALAAWLVWTVADIAHVWVQDRFYFPQTLPGYDDYREKTPFLLPTPGSVRKALRGIAKEGGEP